MEPRTIVRPRKPKQRVGQTWAIRTEFHIGLGENQFGNPIPPEMLPSMRREATHIVAAEFGGATMIPHYGGWVTPEGKYVQESGVTVIAYGHSNQLHAIAQRLLLLTDQRALVAAVIGPKVEAREIFRDAE